MGVVDDGNRHVGGNATGVVDGGVTGVAGLEGACIDDIAFLASRSERLRPAFFLIHHVPCIRCCTSSSTGNQARLND